MIEIGKEEVVAVITGLVGAVVVLWHITRKWGNEERENLRKWASEESERLRQCHTMHQQTHEELQKVTKECAYLNGRIDGITELSGAVLRKIDDVTKNRDSSQ